jgi:uncharacterized protein (TIGR02246 family)
MKRLLALSLGCFLVAACISRTSESNLAVSGELGIRAAESEMVKAAQAKDAAKFASFYTDDAALMVPNAPLATGPAIRQTFDQLFAAPGFSLKFEATKVVVATSGDLGYSQGRYDLTMNDPQGRPMTEVGKYVTVFRKQSDGSWKLTADIFNSDSPPPK